MKTRNAVFGILNVNGERFPEKGVVTPKEASEQI